MIRLRNNPDDPPRVLLIAEACNPDWESVPLVAYNLYRELKSRAAITLVTQVRNRPNLRRRAQPSDRIVYINSELLAKPFSRLGNLLTFKRGLGWTTKQALMWLPYLYFEYLVYRELRSALRTGEFDLIHRVTPLSPTYPSPLASWVDLPFVLGPINGGVPWPRGTTRARLREMEFLSYIRGFYRFLPYVQSTYRRAACILAGSRYTLSRLPEETQSRAVYLPENAIDLRRFSATGRTPPSQIDPFHILFVGRLVPYKGADVVLEAFAASDLLRKTAVLTIVGDGPQRSMLYLLAQTLKVADRVTLTGKLPQDQITPYFRRASVFAFPSVREFGGAVVLEAMACGLPCIVVDYGGPGEYVTQETGKTLPVGSRRRLIPALRGVLEEMCTHRDRLDALSAAGVKRIEGHYTWARRAERICEIYREILTSSSCLSGTFSTSHA